VFIDPFEYDEVRKKVDSNLKRIEEIAKQRQDVLIDELSEESRKLENKMVN